jgi:hypothetical protein
VPFRRI